MLDKIVSLFEKFDRKKQLRVLKKHRSTSVGDSVKIGTGNKFILYPNLKRVSIGNNFDIRDSVRILVHTNAELEIEDNVFMNNFCSVNCLDYVKIGENTLFGENVKIYDHNHAYTRTENHLNVAHTEFTKAPVIIGKNCWLGSNATILKGVTIGDNCIIGSGCTIYQDIPANSTVINKQELIFK